MIEFVYMPPHFEGVEESRILNVFVKVGQSFDIGQILFAYEFDGAFFEERAVKGGRVRAVFFKEGDLVRGKTPIIAYERF